MLIFDKLNSKENMSENEESITEFILTLGKDLKKYSTRNIAESTFTSPATVVRLAKKLGFKGYDDFKEQFLKEIDYLDQQYGKISANFPFRQDDSMMRVANKISHLYEDTVKDTLDLLHHDNLQKALRLVQYSKSIYIFSFGTSLNQAESFREKMLKINKHVIISNNMNYQLYEANCIAKGDIAILISYSGETEKILEIARTCKKNRIPIIAVTSFGENTLSKFASCNLTISTKESMFQNLGDFSTHLSINMILDILYATYFQLNYETNYQNKLENTQNLEGGRYSSNPIIMDETVFHKK